MLSAIWNSYHHSQAKLPSFGVLLDICSELPSRKKLFGVPFSVKTSRPCQLGRPRPERQNVVLADTAPNGGRAAFANRALIKQAIYREHVATITADATEFFKGNPQGLEADGIVGAKPGGVPEVASPQPGAKQILPGEAGVEIEAQNLGKGGAPIERACGVGIGEGVRSEGRASNRQEDQGIKQIGLGIAGEAVGSDHNGRHTPELGGRRKLSGIQLPDPGLQPIHPAANDSELLLEFFEQPLQLIGDCADAFQADIEVSRSLNPDHGLLTAERAIRRASRTAVPLAEIGERLVGPIAGFDVASYVDAGQRLAIPELILAGGLSRQGTKQTQGRWNQKEWLENSHEIIFPHH
jgi:hypothetical protein